MFMFDLYHAYAHYGAYMTHEFEPDDYKHSAPPRTFGSETEYTSPTVTSFMLKYMESTEGVLETPFVLTHGRNMESSILFKNGGELYEEVSTLIEYATPECRTPDELVLQERAGEHATAELLQTLVNATLGPNVVAQLYKRTGYGDIFTQDGERLFKRLSAGHHENYTTSAFNHDTNAHVFHGTTSPHFEQLSSYLATRFLWAGAGMVDQHFYSLSQKRGMINFSNAQWGIEDGNKTPIHFHSDRLEVRSGDGNISEWAIRMKYALTSLVLRLIEHEKFPEKLILQNPTHHADIIAEDPTVLVPTVSGSAITPLEHQSQIIETAYKTLSAQDLVHPYEEQAVMEFSAFKRDFLNTSIPDNSVEALADRVDWATKLYTLHQQGMRYKDIKGTSMSALAADLHYENVPQRNKARKLHSKLGQQLLSEVLVKSALMTPPHTRAARRVNLVRYFMEKDKYSHSYWDLVIDKNKKIHDLGQPY